MLNNFKKFFSWFVARRSRTVLSLLIIIAIGVFAYTKNQGTGESQTQIQTQQVRKGTVVSSISASGSVLSANVMEVSTSVSGVVKEVFVTEGQNVTKGQKIAEVELDSASQVQYASAYSSYQGAVRAVNSANNAYRSSQAVLENVYDQIKGNDTTETLEMKQTRTQAEVSNDNAYDGIGVAKAQLSAATLSYQQSSPVVVAPTSGIITNIGIVPGMTLAGSGGGEAASSSRIAVVEYEGSPLASFNVSELDVSKIKTGMKATITVDSLTDKTFTGKVVSVDKIGTTTSNVTSYPVIIKLDTKADGLLPNMAANASIIVETKSNVLVVPTSAVQTQNNQSTVQVMRSGLLETVTVETGISSDSQIEIISGLSEGDTVVTSTALPTTNQSNSATSPFGGTTRGFGGAATFGGAGGGNVQIRQIR